MLAADAGAPEDLQRTDELHCIEVVTHTGEDKAEYRRLTWYADRRALKEEISQDPEFETASHTMVTVYAEDGRLIRSIGLGEASNARVQEDYFYDSSDNRVDYRFSYPHPPTLDMQSSDEPWLAVGNKNEYDARGRLVATIMHGYGQGTRDARPFRRVFTEDDAGRCASTEAKDPWNSVTREAFRYDDRSRLSEHEVDSGEFMCEHKLSLTTNTTTRIACSQSAATATGHPGSQSCTRTTPMAQRP